MSTDDTAASEHGADAETTKVPPPPRDEPGLAWSVDDDTDEIQSTRHGRIVSAGLIALVVTVAVAVIWFAATYFGHDPSQRTEPPSVSTPTVSTPTTQTSPSPQAKPAPPPPITSATTTQPFPTALPACYRNAPINERPTGISLACKGHWFEDLTWSMWSASGADGKGMEMVKNCNPTCAGGQFFRNRVVVHFDAPAPGPADSGCPTSVLFYTQMIVAYPDLTAVPEFDPRFGPGTGGVTEYNDMPALFETQLKPAC